MAGGKPSPPTPFERELMDQESCCLALCINCQAGSHPEGRVRASLDDRDFQGGI